MKLTKLFGDTDMQAPEEVEIPGGKLFVYTNRAPGKNRNEDSAAVYVTEADEVIMVVADGVGGQPGADQASRIAVEAVKDSLKKKKVPERKVRTAILDAFELANERILKLGIGAASTLLVVEVSRDKLRTYHVGNSEALLLSGQGNEKYRTVSHSPVGLAVEAGLAENKNDVDAEVHHLVTNTVGDGEEMRIEVGTEYEMAVRDVVVLGSDGLFDHVQKDEIYTAIRDKSSEDPLGGLVPLCQERMVDESADEELGYHPDDLTLIVYHRS